MSLKSPHYGGGRLAWLVKKSCRPLLGKSPPWYGGEANLASQKAVSVPSWKNLSQVWRGG